MAEKQSGGSGTLVPVLFAVWALALVIVYLSYRGEDVGRLSTFLGGLAQGPYFGAAGFFGSLGGLLIALVIFLAWFGLGRTITSFTGILRDDTTSRWMNLANAVGIGAATWSLLWFFLGLAGAYRKGAAAVTVAIGLGLAAWQLRGLFIELRAPAGSAKWSGGERLLLGLSLALVLMAVVAALAPPTAKDALFYHLALPKAFVAQGSNAPVEGNIASYFALGTEMQAVSAMLAGSFLNTRVAEAAAGATLFLFFPLLLLSIYGWARELDLSRSWSLLAVFIFAAVPSAYYVAGNSYVDLALSLYVLLALHALGRWWKTLDRGWAIGLAVFLGAAWSAKLTALFVFAGVALIVLLRARAAKDEIGANAGKIFAAGAMALILGGVLASPWYLHTWKATGSPIFPFYMNIWKGQAPGWDAERSHLYQLINSSYGGEHKNALDYLLSPFRISLMAQPELVEYFDGVIGCAFLFGLPILIWAWWKYDPPVEIKAALGVGLVMFLFWLFSSELLRYLLPVFPVLALGICAAGEAIAHDRRRLRQTWQFSLAILSFSGMLTSLAWFARANPVRVVLGGEPRTDYLARNIDYYSYYQYLNTQTPPDAKIWLINLRRDTYHLDRPYFSDFMFEDWTLRSLVWQARDTNELRGKIRQMGIAYVLVRHDGLLDYAHSAIVDDQKTEAENNGKLAMLKELFFDPVNTIRSDKKFSLVKIP